MLYLTINEKPGSKIEHWKLVRTFWDTLTTLKGTAMIRLLNLGTEGS